MLLKLWRLRSAVFMFAWSYAASQHNVVFWSRRYSSRFTCFRLFRDQTRECFEVCLYVTIAFLCVLLSNWMIWSITSTVSSNFILQLFIITKIYLRSIFRFFKCASLRVSCWLAYPSKNAHKCCLSWCERCESNNRLFIIS